MKRKVLPCFMALSMTLTAVPNVAMAEEKQLQETEKTSIVENESLETESLEALVGESSTMLNGGAANGVVPYDANVAKAGDNYYTTLEDAIDNASSGDTVELLSSVEVANTLNIDTGIVLQGSEDAYITFTGASRKTLFDVTTNEQVTLKNVYGEAVNGRIMVLNASSPHVTFENCEFYAKERGISGFSSENEASGFSDDSVLAAQTEEKAAVYLDPSSGNDGNTGESAKSAVNTLSKAVASLSPFFTGAMTF